MGGRGSVKEPQPEIRQRYISESSEFRCSFFSVELKYCHCITSHCIQVNIFCMTFKLLYLILPNSL